MTGRGNTEKLNWPRWAQALLIAVLVLLIGNRMTLVVETAAMRAGFAEERAWGAWIVFPIHKPSRAFSGLMRCIPAGPRQELASWWATI